jgi:hypothetical protein
MSMNLAFRKAQIAKYIFNPLKTINPTVTPTKGME